MIETFKTFEIENSQVIYGGCCAGVICSITGEWIPYED